jgi:GDPmannose 4,6-dehydratase
MAPVNPYGCAKSFATQLVRVYRQSFGIHASSGILYNHESPRRAAGFVTQKICHAAAAISLGQERELKLGDLSARRDWGDARDYVRGMWLCLQEEAADDYVFATGAAHSVKDVVEIAFAAVDLDWKQYVKYDESLVRPVEPHRLIGDATKARTRLSWEPRSSFRDLILEMTRSQHSRLSGHRPGHEQ